MTNHGGVWAGATEQDVIGAFHSERGPQLAPYLPSWVWVGIWLKMSERT